MFTFLNRSALIASLLLIHSLCVAKDRFEPTIDTNYKPDISSDEGGFWYKVDQLEKEVKNSPYLIREEAINNYVKNMVCELAGEYCSSIRVYLIDNPHFNASMYPNGMMHVWSGLLLRVENESQLAAILGHEIAHYLRTHQIEQWRQAHNNAVASIILDVGIAAVTGVYGIATLAMSGNDASFSRQHEKEADLMGADLMAKAGYDPQEASVLWQRVIEEKKQDESKEEVSIFWASHPPSEKRNKYIREYVKSLNYEASSSKSTLFELLSNHYYTLMKNQLALEEHGRTEVLLERHRQLGYPSKYIDFFYGELYRKRGKEGDLEKAKSSYKNALANDNNLAMAHKQLGYLYLKKKEYSLVVNHFEEYLEREPKASDKAMVLYYINMFGKK